MMWGSSMGWLRWVPQGCPLCHDPPCPGITQKMSLSWGVPHPAQHSGPLRGTRLSRLHLCPQPHPAMGQDPPVPQHRAG